MKKLSLLVGGLVLSTAIFAQKPDASVPSTLEGIIGWNASTLSFTAPSLRYRYFLQDNIAARVTFGIHNNTTVDNVYENPDFSGGTGEYIDKTTGWNAAIGAEYHFTGTDRLSPYAGIDIAFGGSKSSTEGTNVDPTGTTYVADASFETEEPSSMFGVGLVAGTDFYFAENFYFGLELGLMWSSMTIKEGTFSSTSGGTTTSGTLNSEFKSSSINTMGTTPTGNLRLGWRF